MLEKVPLLGYSSQNLSASMAVGSESLILKKGTFLIIGTLAKVLTGWTEAFRISACDMVHVRL